MGSLRALARRHAGIAALVVVLALALRALVPTGYMIATGPGGLALTVCPDAWPQASPMPAAASGGHAHASHAASPASDRDESRDQRSEPAEARQACPYAALAAAALAGGDPPILALGAAFAVVLGFAARPRPPLRRARFVLPPSRGPPAPA